MHKFIKRIFRSKAFPIKNHSSKACTLLVYTTQVNNYPAWRVQKGEGEGEGEGEGWGGGGKSAKEGKREERACYKSRCFCIPPTIF